MPSLSPDSPEEPSLVLHGWALDDAEERFQARSGIYWLPDMGDRVAVHSGDHVKLIFEIALPHALDDESHREHMWVLVDDARDGWWRGTLANDPEKPGQTAFGMVVWFRPHHVIDILKEDGWRASEDADLVQCRNHGLSQATFVCSHLTPQARGLGFVTANEPSLTDLRPDAWCHDCDALLQAAGSWDALGDRHPKVRLVCGGCYDRIRELNEQST